jgi:hypothetical protein
MAGAVISREEVHEALSHLYDNDLLAQSSLVDRFAGIAALQPIERRADRLRALFLEAIEVLRPSRRRGFGSPESRHYDVLCLRYVENMTVARMTTDGCSVYAIFFRMILPMSTPALGITAIFSFSGMWNAFLGPMIYLNQMEKFPLALGLRAFQAGPGSRAIHWESMMAISVLMTIPMLVLFFITQRNYIQGIVITGVKG